MLCAKVERVTGITQAKDHKDVHLGTSHGELELYSGVGTIGMDKVICLLKAKLGDHIRLLTFIQILRVEKLPQRKVWKQTTMSLLQYTTEGSDGETSRRRKETKFQKKLMQCLRGRDLSNDYVEEEKCQTWKV